MPCGNGRGKRACRRQIRRPLRPTAEALTSKTAAVVRRITFDGFAANEVYPADINQDGRLELLCLQSAGIFQSEVFNATVNETPDEIRKIFCLTAITLEGKVLWQVGSPCLKFRCAKSHVADQMLWCGRIADKTRPEVAALRGSSLLILDAATGAIKRSADLGADNYGIVRCVHTRQGIVIYPQGCPDGGDAVITRDWPWPQAFNMAVKTPLPSHHPRPSFSRQRNVPRDPTVATATECGWPTSTTTGVQKS